MRSKCCCILVFIVALVSAAGATSISMINPGFETGDLTGWDIGGVWGKNDSVSTDYAHSGSYSDKIVNDGSVSGSDIYGYSLNCPVGGDWNAHTIAAGDTLILTAWVLNPSSDPLKPGETGRLGISVAGDTSGWLYTYSDTLFDGTLPQDTWVQVSYQLTVPQGDYRLLQIEINMLQSSSMSGGTVYADDFHIDRILAGSCQAGVYLEGDINEDCYVNFQDFALLAQNWLKDNYLY
ncbi:MAG: hypothetical protein A2Y12_05625 [Planctomycetes bacterium GWF2_42_9]|nr:MAG: hypothetical protein A2Y12_05625 [Planctomycetes bacterium GWF2_42_9]